MTLTSTVLLFILIPVPGALPTLKPAAEIFPFSSFFPSTYNIRDRLLYGTFSMVCLLIFLILPIPKIKKTNNLLGSSHRLSSRRDRSPGLRPRLRRSLQASPGVRQIRWPTKGSWQVHQHLERNHR